MNTIDRPIGSNFISHSLIYEVREMGENGCKDCCLCHHDEDESFCLDDGRGGDFGECSANCRRDGKDVIFKQIGEVVLGFE